MKDIRYMELYPNDVNMVDTLWNTLDWVQHPQSPRREYYCNTSANVPYTYGTPPYHRTYYPQPVPQIVEDIWLKTEIYIAQLFDVCFLNGYEDQRQHLGWHADDSPEMDDNYPIAVVSFGAARYIEFREKGKGQVTARQLLKNGSLLVMPPGFQDKYEHRIPKSDRIVGKRISLTFRVFVNTSN